MKALKLDIPVSKARQIPTTWPLSIWDRENCMPFQNDIINEIGWTVFVLHCANSEDDHLVFVWIYVYGEEVNSLRAIPYDATECAHLFFSSKKRLKILVIEQHCNFE